MTSNKWITDANSNRASVEFWGSEEAATASLTTLIDCTDCTDCIRCTCCTRCTLCTDCTLCTLCTRCSRCTLCIRCTDCIDCTRCTNCIDCTCCDLSLPHHRLPVSDPRGYTWLAIADATGAWRIHAGCHNFTVDEARSHWLSPKYTGPGDVVETMGAALDWIAKKKA